MTNEKRVKEILSQITAFPKNSYERGELLPELDKLQDDFARIVFKEPQENDNKQVLWKVSDHLTKQNEELGHIADAELKIFIKGCKRYGNISKAEYYGRRGEEMAFAKLRNLRCPHILLENVELEDEDQRTEIDAVVITNKAIFLIEVKNNQNNVFIDENGGLYKVGSNMHYNGNIIEKFEEREKILRKIIEPSINFHLKVFRVVVFTKKNIDVQKKCRRLKVCNCEYLPVLIEEFVSSQCYTEDEMSQMESLINTARCKEPYKKYVDMSEFKNDFAVLVAKLEGKDNSENEPETIEETPPSKSSVAQHNTKTSRCWNAIHSVFNRRIANVVIVSAITIGLCGLGGLLRK